MLRIGKGKGADCGSAAIMDVRKARGWHRPVKVSLGLLPSGPDPVGEEHVRANLPGRYIGDRACIGKSERTGRWARGGCGGPSILQERSDAYFV